MINTIVALFSLNDNDLQLDAVVLRYRRCGNKIMLKNGAGYHVQ